MHFYHDHASMYDGCKDRVRRAHSQLTVGSFRVQGSGVACPSVQSLFL